jgi:hypothetical protein
MDMKKISRELKSGAKIEGKEHRVPYFLARKIARDHLRENPDYYERLKKCRL